MAAMHSRAVAMITIRDVARQAGVSVATVSRVLNNSALVSPETRETVMKAVAALGYRPNANAQALATQVSDTIGVVVMDVSDPFFGALVKAVDTIAQLQQKYDNGIAVPQQVSVIGFDDIPLARYTDPQLTTIRYPIISMAKLATELALLGAAGKLDASATHCFMPTLVRRHSVAQRQSVLPVTN